MTDPFHQGDRVRASCLMWGHDYGPATVLSAAGPDCYHVLLDTPAPWIPPCDGVREVVAKCERLEE